MAGYSHRPLAAKLGLSPGLEAVVLGAPAGYQEALAAPPGVKVTTRLASGHSFIQCFVRSRDALAAELATLRAALTANGMLWICWPKKSSGVESDLSGNVVRELALAHRLVDVKVCAVDEVWSGLKLVIPVADR